ncbi:MAG: outer membrane beta-barrel protein [Saprospiraceae bacterium]|nr:outer membrane beta-barrel protein [Saprospiraceae bacterium]MBK7809652.1 outer membrane beta-barrel protein [Saprospiraceae bacterium]MBK9632236.1 outer membrane beta-barrel protein [Saprospiraceae bacterium]
MSGYLIGQTTELSFRLNSGLFSFTGASAESVEKINYNLETEDGYTNNPYGNKPALSIGASINLSRILSSNLKFGIDLAYEILRSKIEIDGVHQNSRIINETIVANGQSYLNFSYINLFPSIGYRIKVSDFNLDIDGGMDFGYCLKAYERGYAKSSTREYETQRDRKTINFDFRPRLQIAFIKNSLGLYLGYSVGLVNYKSGFAGGVNEAYSNMIRFGLIYKPKFKSL